MSFVFGRKAMSSNSYRFLIIIVTAIILFPSPSLAQSSGGQTEVTSGGYAIHQTMEAGFRFSDQTGSTAMYDSLVNLQTGPRILEQTLTMQSLTHESLLFDNLYVNSFGWGGDPNNLFRARADKSKWYTFSANFRRDLNRFDYDLLANPLNPPNSNPNLPILDSPHRMMLTRRMTDLNLHLLPQSFVSFRLGWSRVVNEGNAFSSIHQGTDAQLNQATRDTNDNYRFGIALRFLPKSTINYDHFYSYFRGDSIAALNAVPYRLSGGTAVDLGLAFNTPAGQPCAIPILSTGVVNPACNGFFAYNRFPQTRNSIHTDQISLQSHYFHRLDLSGRVAYSDAQSKMPSFLEFFDGLITRSRVRTSLQAGSGSTKRVSANADLGLTLRVTDRLRIVDTFRFDNFRIPGTWDIGTVALFGATLLSRPNQFNPATCPPPFTAATCPQHNSSSSADLSTELFNSSLKQDQKLNTVQAEYDFSRRFTGRLGYRYSRRTIAHSFSDFQTLVFYPTLPNRGACAGKPLVNGVCTVTTSEDVINPALDINGHSGLAGFSARPDDTLRVFFDAELFYADHSFLRISPRKEARYRLQANYTPRRWAVLSANANILQNSNRDLLTDYRGHNRNYGFTASLAPREFFAIDLAYNYNDYLQNALICFADTDATLTVVTSARSCIPSLGNLFNDPGNPLLTNSYYLNRTHFGMGLVMFKPVKRVTTQLGYSLTSVGGKSPVFNRLQPNDTLHYDYHQPLANIGVELHRNLTWNAGWNYYQYNEKSFVGPTATRYFHANNATLSLRYSF
jgi:opacity protein-like surface antigen